MRPDFCLVNAIARRVVTASPQCHGSVHTTAGLRPLSHDVARGSRPVRGTQSRQRMRRIRRWRPRRSSGRARRTSRAAAIGVEGQRAPAHVVAGRSQRRDRRRDRSCPRAATRAALSALAETAAPRRSGSVASPVGTSRECCCLVRAAVCVCPGAGSLSAISGRSQASIRTPPLGRLRQRGRFAGRPNPSKHNHVLRGHGPYRGTAATSITRLSLGQA